MFECSRNKVKGKWRKQHFEEWYIMCCYIHQKDFVSMKNPLTPAGIEPATFRFVAPHLDHGATAVPCEHIREEKVMSNSAHLRFAEFTRFV